MQNERQFLHHAPPPNVTKYMLEQLMQLIERCSAGRRAARVAASAVSSMQIYLDKSVAAGVCGCVCFRLEDIEQLEVVGYVMVRESREL
jgi:hypothetical protein